MKTRKGCWPMIFVILAALLALIAFYAISQGEAPYLAVFGFLLAASMVYIARHS